MALGSDEAGLNDAKDLFQEMRLVLKLHRGRRIDGETVIVDGDVIMRDRQLTRVDKSALFTKAQKSSGSPPKTRGTHGTRHHQSAPGTSRP